MASSRRENRDNNVELLEVEGRENTAVFSWHDIPLEMLGIARYVFDVYTDIRLGLQLLSEGDAGDGGITLGFVALAYVVMTAYGLLCYWRQQNDEDNADHWCVWFLRNLSTILMLGPVVQTIEYLYNGCRSKCASNAERQAYLDRMQRHQMNGSYLRLLEGCVEAAPQLVFQLFVLVVTKPRLRSLDGVWRVATIVSSWVSLVSVVADWNMMGRNSNGQRIRASLRHKFFDILWRLWETGGRVLCIALFASVFRYWVLLVLGLHWLIVAIAQSQKHQHEREGENESYLWHLLFAYVFVYCYLDKYKTKHSWRRYVAFYVLFYAENFTMLGLWYFYTPDKELWFHRWALVAGLTSLPLHVMLQLFYYRFCHPKSHVRHSQPREVEMTSVISEDTWRDDLFGKHGFKRTKREQNELNQTNTSLFERFMSLFSSRSEAHTVSG